MAIYVACDVCGHRYVMPDEREGRSSKCKSCGVSFELDRENFYDPDTSEMDDEDEDEDNGDGESSLSPLWNIASKVGHGLAGLVTFAVLLWMASLLFRSPKEVAAQSGRPPAAVSAQKAASNRTQPPQFQPNPRRPRVVVQPHVPPQLTPPTPFPQPQPIDGSIGWPSDDTPNPTNSRRPGRSR